MNFSAQDFHLAPEGEHRRDQRSGTQRKTQVEGGKLQRDPVYRQSAAERSERRWAQICDVGRDRA